jgi:hypothetical protein
VKESGMDTKHGAIAELLALKDAPDDALLDQMQPAVSTAIQILR